MLDNNLLDTSMEMDMDTDTDLPVNMDLGVAMDTELNTIIKQENNESPEKASTSTTPPTIESNNHVTPEFKAPEPKIIIKQEMPDNGPSHILVSSSQPIHNNIKRESMNHGTVVTSTSNVELNNIEMVNDDDNYDEYEICPPSPEENIATSIFSSQFDRDLSKSKQVSIIIMILYAYMM